MKEIATIRFVDRETADEGVAFVRADTGSVALSLSLRADGDIQVLLAPGTASAWPSLSTRRSVRRGRPLETPRSDFPAPRRPGAFLTGERMQIDPATITFVARLVDVAPELRPLYAEHLADDDELLPHVFMGDVSRFVEALHEQALAPAEDADATEEVLRRILARLDEGLATGSDAVQGKECRYFVRMGRLVEDEGPSDET